VLEYIVYSLKGTKSIAEKFFWGVFMKIKSIIFVLSFLTANITLPQTVTLFSHGIADKWSQIHRYLKKYWKNGILHSNTYGFIHTPFVSFNYPDATNRFYRVNYYETSFGQSNEINRIYKTYQKTIEHFGDCDIILYGLSRGASNLVIFAGMHQLDNVKALVLESPYCSMTEVIAHVMNKKGVSWLPISYGEALAEFLFKKYTRHGNTPEKYAANIPLDMPILIVCSEEDTLVPCSTSFNLYKQLVKTGHRHVYIFMTEKGRHAFIIQGPDGEKYEAVANAFYKKYNLTHDAASAAKGEELLAQCQPDF
jgi:hypothetical protein